MRTFIKALLISIGFRWCRMMHRSGDMWPYRDHYECKTCQRRHPIKYALNWPTVSR